MRDNYTSEKLEAARILDMVRAGIEVPDSVITWALLTLGDYDGL